MKYTYKLDEKGLPYRVEAGYDGAVKNEEKSSCFGLTLLRHEGKLRTFNLYNLAL